MKSHPCDCLNVSKTRTTIGTLMWTGGKPTRPQTQTKNYRQLEGAENRRKKNLLQGRAHQYLSNTKWSVTKAYM